jgi:hypothetical protein
MFKFLKYLPLLLKLKEVSEIYEAETGKPRPALISRRFLGAVLLLISAGLAKYFDITIPENMIETIADNIDAIIVAAIGIYGGVMGVVGIVKKK